MAALKHTTQGWISKRQWHSIPLPSVKVNDEMFN